MNPLARGSHRQTDRQTAPLEDLHPPGRAFPALSTDPLPCERQSKQLNSSCSCYFNCESRLLAAVHKYDPAGSLRLIGNKEIEMQFIVTNSFLLYSRNVFH